MGKDAIWSRAMQKAERAVLSRLLLLKKKAARKSLQQCSRPQFHCDVSNVAGATENSRRTTDKPQPNELT